MWKGRRSTSGGSGGKLKTHRSKTKPEMSYKAQAAPLRVGRVWGFPGPASQTARRAVVCHSGTAGSERRTRLAGEVCLSCVCLNSSRSPGVEGDSSFRGTVGLALQAGLPLSGKTLNRSSLGDLKSPGGV